MVPFGLRTPGSGGWVGQAWQGAAAAAMVVAAAPYAGGYRLRRGLGAAVQAKAVVAGAFARRGRPWWDPVGG